MEVLAVIVSVIALLCFIGAVIIVGRVFLDIQRLRRR